MPVCHLHKNKVTDSTKEIGGRLPTDTLTGPPLILTLDRWLQVLRRLPGVHRRAQWKLPEGGVWSGQPPSALPAVTPLGPWRKCGCRSSDPRPQGRACAVPVRSEEPQAGTGPQAAAGDARPLGQGEGTGWLWPRPPPVQGRDLGTQAQVPGAWVAPVVSVKVRGWAGLR